MHWQRMKSGITGTAFARACGTSYRVVDYWCRTDVLCPSVAMVDGSGSVRLYSTDDVALGRVLVAMRAHGSENDSLRRAVDALRSVPTSEWPGKALLVPASGPAVVGACLVDVVLAMEADALVGALVVRLDGVLEPEDLT